MNLSTASSSSELPQREPEINNRRRLLSCAFVQQGVIFHRNTPDFERREARNNSEWFVMAVRVCEKDVHLRSQFQFCPS